jgi:hypothetical protein
MAYGNAFETRKQWTVEVVRCTNEWAKWWWRCQHNDMKERIHAELTEWTNESMHEWNSESMNQWTVDQWMGEFGWIWWVDEPMSQSISEQTMSLWTMHQSVDDSMNQWTIESVSQWILNKFKVN